MITIFCLLNDGGILLNSLFINLAYGFFSLFGQNYQYTAILFGKKKIDI